MAIHAQRGGDATRGLNLDAVALVVIDRQREHAKSLLTGEGGADHGIQPTGEQDNSERAFRGNGFSDHGAELKA